MKVCRRGLHEYEGRQCPDCQRVAKRRYRQSEKGRENERRYRSGERGRKTQATRNARRILIGKDLYFGNAKTPEDATAIRDHVNTTLAPIIEEMRKAM